MGACSHLPLLHIDKKTSIRHSWLTALLHPAPKPYFSLIHSTIGQISRALPHIAVSSVFFSFVPFRHQATAVISSLMGDDVDARKSILAAAGGQLRLDDLDV